MYSTTVKEEIKKDLKSILSAHRYKHVLGVAKAARQLALQNDCDPDKAEVAGLLARCRQTTAPSGYAGTGAAVFWR